MVPQLEAVEALPAVTDPDPEVWLDNAGCPVAFGSLRSPARIEFPGQARFEFHLGGGPVRVASLSAGEEWIEDAYYRSVAPLVLQARGEEALHASAVDTSGGVVAFAARSGTGKSTLAAALGDAGYSVWADDVVLWRREECGAHVAIPVPFRAKADGWRTAPLARAHRQRPLKAVCLLERLPPGEPLSVTACPPRQVLLGILPHAYCFSLRDPERKRAMVRQYLELSSSIPVWSVRYPSGYGELPGVMQKLQSGILGPEI
ncbi:MAG: hypothetical protein R2762_12460 [Bryobacteraceae bacterium]